MSEYYDSTKCLARTAKNPLKQCSNCPFGSESFCRIHLKAKTVQRIDKPIVKNTPNKTQHHTQSEIIPISSCNRLRLSQIKVASLKTSLRFYNLSDVGVKSTLFSRLQTYFGSLSEYVANTPNIQKIQGWYRSMLWKQVQRLHGPALNNYKCCVNEEDILTFDKIAYIPKKYLFSFRDADSFVYGFDIRTIKEILKRDSENPYNRRKLSETVVNNADKLMCLLEILGVDISIKQEPIEDPYLQMKQKAVDIFQQMDSLDQYTNPEWFLALRNYELANYYKEAEDIWNYRLGLTDQTKCKIYPPTGNVFPIAVNVVKKKTDKLELQNICLDFMEKLITRSSKRDDRVNGCIYALLGLVIVSPEAAEALPSYYSMVSVHSNNNEIVPI
jgi:hypothetical protein